jgi:hypothetical protein
VRYVLESDITDRYLLSEYAPSISANVGILVVITACVLVLVPVPVLVVGTTVVADFGSLMNVLCTQANGLLPLFVV